MPPCYFEPFCCPYFPFRQGFDGIRPRGLRARTWVCQDDPSSSQRASELAVKAIYLLQFACPMAIRSLSAIAKRRITLGDDKCLQQGTMRQLVLLEPLY